MRHASIRVQSFSRIRSAMLLCFIPLFASLPVAGQNPPAVCVEPIQSQTLLDELRKLRIELLQERVERADQRLAGLQQELQKTEAERQRVAQMERGRVEELAELQERWTQPERSPEDRTEIDKQRSQLMTIGAARLAEREAEVQKRESELREQLSRQQQHRLELVETLRVLWSHLPSSQTQR